MSLRREKSLKNSHLRAASVSLTVLSVVVDYSDTPRKLSRMNNLDRRISVAPMMDYTDDRSFS
jgi:hypothetical protein